MAKRAWRRAQIGWPRAQKKEALKRIITGGSFIALIYLVGLFSVPVCYGRVDAVISGKTMGTTYHITLVGGGVVDAVELKQNIDLRLEEINRIFSTYDPESEISRFNRLAKVNQGFGISGEFYQVMVTAKKIHTLSRGAWDGTLLPLIKLWGFGPGRSVHRIPAPHLIRQKLSQVGFQKIRLLENRALSKTDGAVSLDLSSIAKGYGVDQIAELIRRTGIPDFLVEIGGEIFAAGKRKDGKPWRVGVNLPIPGAPLNQVYKVLAISDQAFATSGDYRNFFKDGGRLYSHILDPRTGYPVRNGVVSVSVVAGDCTLADGLATAIMVMGVEKGMALVNRLEKVECMIIVMEGKEKLGDHYSKGFIVE